MRLRVLLVCSFLTLLALPTFAMPDEELQYNFYDSSGCLIGGHYIHCWGPPFVSSWGSTSDYFTLEQLSVCQWENEMPDCYYFGTEPTECPGYCVSSDYRGLVELDVIEDECVE